MQQGRWRLSNELILWHSVALATICLSVGFFSYYSLLRPLETELPKQAERFAIEFAEEIQTDLWNLDSEGIRAQLRKQYLNPSLLGVRVENQFGEALAEWISLEAGTTPEIIINKPVFLERELIGQISVSWSCKPIRMLREGLWPAILGITVGGTLIQIILTWSLTQRFLRRPLFAVVNRMRNTARGNYDATPAMARHQEINLLNKETTLMAERIRERTESLEKEITKRQQIASELIKHREELELLVQQRTGELDLANRELRREMEQRKLAQRTIIQVSTHEQQRIGQDLHDTLGQEIVGARYLLSSLERAIESAAPQYLDRLRQLATMLHDIMEHARMLAHGLMVVNLNDGGLAAALANHAKKVADLFSIKCRFRQDDPDAAPFDQATAVQLYFIAQEAINNAIRHGHASRVRIRLGRTDGNAYLQITDNGNGFIPENGGGTGLIIMQSRAESVGGALRVWSRPGIGSCIRCRL